MFRSWFKHRKPDASALTLAVHAAARQTDFYTKLAVPDSFDGRFELLVLHAHLIIRRLRADGEAGQALAQGLFDAVTAHFDEALRAIGVGDMSVGKRIKTMTKGFYGRLAAYDAGCDSHNPEDLVAALRRNLYGTVPEVEREAVEAVADYMRRTGAHLDSLPYDAIVAAKGLFPALLAPGAALGSGERVGG